MVRSLSKDDSRCVWSESSRGVGDVADPGFPR